MTQHSPTPSAHRLLAFSIEADASGERLPVELIRSADVGLAEAIAAVIEAASVDAGLTFVEYLGRITALAPEATERRLAAPDALRGGRPAYDWKRDYGRSAPELNCRAELRRVIDPELAMAAARRAVLVRARVKASKHALPDARITADAERLKQAARAR